MKIRLHVAISNHPQRSATDLLDMLQAPDRVTVVTDANLSGCWPNYKRCLLALPAAATHLLVLHDDAEVCADFMIGAEQAIAAQPAQMISFFGTRKVIETARAAGGAWATMKAPLMSLAFCWPRRLVTDFLLWEARHVLPTFSNRYDDSRVRMWCLATQRLMWVTAPSLAEHAGYNRSMMGNGPSVGGRERKAKWYIGREQSAAGIDWTAGRDNPPHDNSGSLSAYAEAYRE